MSAFRECRRLDLLDVVLTVPLLGTLTIMGICASGTCVRSCEATVGLCVEVKLWVRLLGVLDVWCRGETGGFSDTLRLRWAALVALAPHAIVDSTWLSLLRTSNAVPPCTRILFGTGSGHWSVLHHSFIATPSVSGLLDARCKGLYQHAVLG